MKSNTLHRVDVYSPINRLCYNFNFSNNGSIKRETEKFQSLDPLFPTRTTEERREGGEVNGGVKGGVVLGGD